MPKKLSKKRSKSVGLPPGSLVHLGEKKREKTTITVINYSPSDYGESQTNDVNECNRPKDGQAVTWVNVDAIHQVEIIEKIGERFGIHSLVLEDILHTDQRPKTEDHGDYIFIVLKMLNSNDKNGEIVIEETSLIFGNNYVLSFQEDIEGDAFNPVRDRLRNGRGHIRELGADYLAYSLLDAVIDNYFIILEKLGDRIEVLEEELISRPSPQALQSIYKLKREMIFLRKSVWPLREVISGLIRGDSSLIGDSTKVYLRDIYDHTIQVVETVETFRDMLSGMLDVYLSSVSFRMNEVMKVLTLIATIFMPLTFIAGVYGMNFENMPELKWRWGYFASLIIMGGLGLLMLIYFKRKKWM